MNLEILYKLYEINKKMPFFGHAKNENKSIFKKNINLTTLN